MGAARAGAWKLSERLTRRLTGVGVAIASVTRRGMLAALHCLSEVPSKALRATRCALARQGESRIGRDKAQPDRISNESQFRSSPARS